MKKIKKHYSIFSVLFLIGIAHCGNAQNSALILDGADIIMDGGSSSERIYLVVDGETPDAIVRNTGKIVSENQFNILSWKTNNLTGNYIFPFGILGNVDDYIPFTFKKTTTTSSDIEVSTWATDNANQPYPEATNVGAVTEMTGDTEPISKAIDRFWDIQAASGTTADLSFSYRASENSTVNPTNEVAAQHWNGSSWDAPVISGTNGVTSGIGEVGPIIGQNSFSPWVLVIINDCPEDSIYYNVDSFCANDQTNYTINHTNNELTGTYSSSPTGLDLNESSGEISISSSNAGTYTITYTVPETSFCPELNVSTEITIFPEIILDFLILDVTCADITNGSISVIADGGVEPYDYAWNNGEINETISNLPAGSYAVTVTDDNGCSVTDSATIVVPDAISISGNVVNSTCGNENGSVSTTVFGGSGGYSYQWSNGETTPNIEGMSAGDYVLSVIDENGCEFNQEFSIDVSGNLTMTVQPNDTTILSGENVALFAAVQDIESEVEYIWTPENSLSCSDCNNPIASPNENTTYTVTATTPDGCTTSEEVIINIDMQCSFFVPNIFSPNGDGKNDYLCVHGNEECIQDFHFEVFARWGEMIFSTDTIQECWDGKFKDKKLNTASFVYSLRVITYEGQVIEESGNINLLR